MREILVRDGDLVVAGQVLVRLDPTLAGADSKSVAGDIELRRLTLRRIDAELANQTLALGKGEDPTLFLQVQAQGSARRQSYLDSVAQENSQRDRIVAELRAATETLNKLTATAPLVQQQADAYDKLVKDGFFSPLAVQDKRREAINLQQDLKSQEGTVASLRAQMSGQDKKIANLTSQYRSQLQNERVETQAQLAKLDQEATKQSYRQAMLELKAPQGGIVKDLATTTIGAVVAPGTVFADHRTQRRATDRRDPYRPRRHWLRRTRPAGEAQARRVSIPEIRNAGRNGEDDRGGCVIGKYSGRKSVFTG